jgi:hypothetical protein
VRLVLRSKVTCVEQHGNNLTTTRYMLYMVGPEDEGYMSSGSRVRSAVNGLPELMVWRRSITVSAILFEVRSLIIINEVGLWCWFACFDNNKTGKRVAVLECLTPTCAERWCNKQIRPANAMHLRTACPFSMFSLDLNIFERGHQLSQRLAQSQQSAVPTLTRFHHQPCEALTQHLRRRSRPCVRRVWVPDFSSLGVWG